MSRKGNNGAEAKPVEVERARPRKTLVRLVKLEADELEAVELRKQGFLLKDIAERQGVTISCAQKRIVRAMQEIGRQRSENAEELLDEHLFTLGVKYGQLEEVLYGLKGDAEAGIPKSALAFVRTVVAQVRVLRERASLLGLHASDKSGAKAADALENLALARLAEVLKDAEAPSD